MKNLNKKISAVVLAGMIVAGGCLSNGVIAQASSAVKASSAVQNQWVDNPYSDLEYVISAQGILGYKIQSYIDVYGELPKGSAGSKIPLIKVKDFYKYRDLVRYFSDVESFKVYLENNKMLMGRYMFQIKGLCYILDFE